MFLARQAFRYLSIAYSFDVEYRFEVAAIGVDWTVLMVAGTLLAVASRRETRRSSGEKLLQL